MRPARSRARPRVVPAVLAILAWSVAPAAEARGILVGLVPAAQTVAPGSEFVLSIDVTRAGEAFNAFDAVVGYDPKVLTLLPQTPVAQQEGAYFSAACANRFHRFRHGAGRDTITDVLLCPNAALTGPGRIYTLRFRASSTAQVTTVRFLPGLQFYSAGLFVNPDSSTDAVVGIGVPVEGDLPRPTAPRLKLAAQPDSTRDSVALVLDVDRAGEQQLLVFDAQGRLVRRLDHGEYAAGGRTLAWDGRNDAGEPVAAGAYVVRLRVPGQVGETRVTITR